MINVKRLIQFFFFDSAMSTLWFFSNSQLKTGGIHSYSTHVLVLWAERTAASKYLHKKDLPVPNPARSESRQALVWWGVERGVVIVMSHG